MFVPKSFSLEDSILGPFAGLYVSSTDGQNVLVFE